MRKWNLKFTILLTALMAAPLCGFSDELTSKPLECKEDSPPGDDPYKGMKDAKKKEVEADYPALQRIGVSTQHRAKMVSSLNFALGRVCKAQKEFKAAAEALDAKAKVADTAACDAFRTFEADYETLATLARAYEKKVQEEGKSLLNTLDKEATAESALIQSKGKRAEMKESFEKAWGLDIDPSAPLGNRDAVIKRGLEGKMSGPIFQIQSEYGIAVKRREEFSFTYAKAKLANTKCASLAGVNPANPGQIPDNPTGPGPGFRPAEGTGYDSPGPPPGTSSVGQWASDNKELLIVGGAGVAGVAGILYFKKQQDKKEKKEQARYDAAVAEIMASKNGNGGGEDDDENANPNAPSENRSLHITGAPSSAKVDQTLSPIAASIRDKDGNPVQESGAAITVSCTSSCSLTGTLSRTTSNGLAEFNDLKFTGAHTGVQLRFESSGLNSVTTPGSFNVAE